MPPQNLLRFVEILNRVEATPIDLLRNHGYLSSVIGEAGLAHAHHDMYGPYKKLMNGKDEIGISQNPWEFAATLIEICNIPMRVACEIGSYHGGTAAFLCTYLRRFNPDFSMVSVDIKPHPFLRVLSAHVKALIFVEGTSHALRHQYFDLSFIDAEHSYRDVSTDYENVGAHSRVTILHDIDDCFVKGYPDGGVPRFWAEVASSRRSLEIKDPCHANHFGIGILL